MSKKGTALTIGIAAPLSGQASLLGLEMKQAVELAIDEVNRERGASGGKISALALDDASDVERGRIVAEQFSKQADVVAVIGHYSSDVSIAAAQVYRQASLAMVTPIASNPDLTAKRFPNVFRFTNRDDHTGFAIAQFLYRKLGKRRAALVESDTAYGRSMAQRFAEAFERIGGDIVYRKTVRSGERNFEGVVSSLPKDFDFLFYGGSFEGAYILRAMRTAGLEQKFAAGDGCWDKPNFLAAAGHASMEGEGVLILSATPEIGRVPGSREFAEQYSKRFGPITNYAVNSYDAGRLVLDAVFRINDGGHESKRLEVLTAIRSTRHQGIAYPRPVHWDERGDNLASLTALYEVRDAAFHEIAEVPSDAAL
jgi:branched-chain amino acid transport system substrate-binding protein